MSGIITPFPKHKKVPKQKRVGKQIHTSIKARTRHSYSGSRMVPHRHKYGTRNKTEAEGTKHELHNGMDRLKEPHCNSRYVVGRCGNWIKL